MSVYAKSQTAFALGTKSIHITIITEGTIYIDGEININLPDAEGGTIGEIFIDSVIQIIAVKGSTNLGSVAGIIASSTDDSIVTDSTWKCTNVEEEGWMDIDYNDAAWPTAVPVEETDLKMYGRDKKFGSRAKHIWTAKKTDSYDQTVYCRAFFGMAIHFSSLTMFYCHHRYFLVLSLDFLTQLPCLTY